MKTNCKKLGLLPIVAMMMAASTFAVWAADKNENAGSFSSSDYKLVKNAACDGMMEVKLGNIAASNSKNNAVQQFGLRMVNDHGKAGQQLAQIASNKGATLPSDVTAHQQREIDKMAKLSGRDFDKDYISAMVRDHKSAERLFKKGSEEAEDPDLRAWFANTLPTIQEHLRMAQDLDRTVKNELSMNK